MTRSLAGKELHDYLVQGFGAYLVDYGEESIFIDPQKIEEVCEYLRSSPELEFSFLNSITAVDYVEYFEVVYHITSFSYNTKAVLKVRVYGREEPVLPSVCSVWPGANFQEREIFDLMGLSFKGHPNLKRIMLWEGFPGHPHRRDFEDVVKY
tara:strand:+ start:531 stop:986 length:456 start_codon:yes stop_codon:yes gene_type:complete